MYEYTKRKRQIYKAAKKLVKDLSGDVDFEGLCEYARFFGYDVIISDENNSEYLRYATEPEDKQRKAFTLKSDISVVFIKRNKFCHYSKYLDMLLHELGHIVLGHMDGNFLELHDDQYCEAEVSAFICAVHYYSIAYKKFHLWR